MAEPSTEHFAESALDSRAADSTRGSEGIVAARAVANEEILPLTSLRGLLAWAVVLFHLDPLLIGLFPVLAPLHHVLRVGDAAVDVFFLLSGYVIFLVYGERSRRFTARSYRSFLWARLARLYPVHLTQQLAWLIALGLAIHWHKAGFTEESLDLEDFARNVLLVHSWGLPMRMYANYPAWSISMEWFAYLTTPLVFALNAAVRGPRSRWLLAAMLWAVLIASHETLLNHYCRILCAFTVGAMLASSFPPPLVSERFARVRLPIGLAIVFTLVVLGACNLPYTWTLPLDAALVVALTAPATRGPMSSRFLVLAGRASYSLYMTHALSVTLMHQVLHPARFEGATFAARVGVVGAYVAVITLLGWLSFRLIEEPARLWMRGLARKARWPLRPDFAAGDATEGGAPARPLPRGGDQW